MCEALVLYMSCNNIFYTVPIVRIKYAAILCFARLHPSLGSAIKLRSNADDEEVEGEMTSLLVLEYHNVPQVPRFKGWTTQLTCNADLQHRIQALFIGNGGTLVVDDVVVVDVATGVVF